MPGRLVSGALAMLVAVSAPSVAMCSVTTSHAIAHPMAHHAMTHMHHASQTDQTPKPGPRHGPDCAMMQSCLGPAATTPALTIEVAVVQPERPLGELGSPLSVDNAPDPPPPRG